MLNRRQEVVGVADEGWRGVDSLVEEITGPAARRSRSSATSPSRPDARRMVDTAAALAGQAGHPGERRGRAAGPGPPRHRGRARSSVWDLQIAVNLRGTFLMSRFAVPHMRAQRWGRIINISSQAGAGRRGHVHRVLGLEGRRPRLHPGAVGRRRAVGDHRQRDLAPAWSRPSRRCSSLDPDSTWTAEIKRRGADARGRPLRVPGGHRGGGRLPGLGRSAVHDRPDPGARRRRRPGSMFGEEAAGSKRITARTGRTMSPRTTPPFRADHVGSLLRPPGCTRPGPSGRRGDHGRGAAGGRGRGDPGRRSRCSSRSGCGR